MSYSGNMPDWHQYNPPQAGRIGSSSLPQNVNSGHHFISSINPSELDTINLSNDRQTKHQRNDVNYQNRNYPVQSIGQNCPTSSTLTSSTCQPGVHMSPMSNCVGHYSSTTTIDPRLGPVGLTEPEISHRTSQMTFPNPPNHGTAATNLSVNPSIHSGITAQTSPVGSMSPSRQSYGTCKGPCCNPDTNIAYQHWEKYGHYQPAPSAFRENLRPSNYPIESRRFLPDIRKECLEKEIGQTPFPVDHRRSYPDYKYRKDIPKPPGYQASSLLPNYPMQNYNYPEYQKCLYPFKEYPRRGNTNVPSHTSQSTSVIKYPEQQNMLVQQKYNSKQLNYQNGNLQTPMPNTNSTNLPTPLQSSYFNSPMTREVQREFPRDFQDPSSMNRIQPPISSTVLHGNYQKIHPFQHKLNMQRFAVENSLKGFPRTNNYQNHQKYQESLTRYKEMVQLQNFEYHNVLQESQKIPPASLNPPIPPINLQFDQNGVLMNSSYNPGHFSGLHNPGNQLATSENIENPEATQVNQIQNQPDSTLLQQNLFNKHQDQTLNLSRDAENLLHNMRRVNEHYQLPENRREHYENHIVDVDGIDSTCIRTTTATDSLETTVRNTSIQERNLRDFTDKPQLDVRQFLANWDETEDEEALANNAQPEIPSNHLQEVVQSCQQLTPTNALSNRNNVENPQNQSVTTPTTTEISEIEKQTSASPLSKASTTSEEIDVTGLKTIEELASSGTIVQCIQSDADDIPTIHLVDHLPNDNELATIQTVYGAVTSLQIEQINSSPIEVIDESPNTSETITLFGQDTGVCSKDAECRTEIEENEREEVVASIIESSKESSKSPEISKINSDASPILEENLKSKEDESNNGVNEINESNEKNQENPGNSDLRKQHSFASEESHNPDDLSLPELPECTPISTTLNTPIHSDSEESSGHVADLAISTNPIEIIQNSPIISFTHSPIKIDPYGNLENERLSEKRPDDSLDFDFSHETNKNSKTLVEDFEVVERSSSDTISVPTEQQQNSVALTEHNQDRIDKNEEFYPSSDPLVGMSPSKKVPSKQSSPKENSENSNDMVQDESLDHRILSNDEIHTEKCSLIDSEDFQGTDDLDKLCNISLDSSCMMQLLPEHSQEPRIPPPTLDTKNFTKSMKNITNISPIPNLDGQDTSDDEQLDKDDDWIEVRSMDGPEDSNKSANELLNPQEEVQNKPAISCVVETNSKEPEIDEGKPMENSPYIRSIFDTTSEDSQSTGFDEFNKRKETKDGKNRLKSLREFRKVKSHYISRQRKIPEIVSDKKIQLLNVDSMDKVEKSPDHSEIQRIKSRENIPEVVGKILETINLQIEKSGGNNEQLKSMETCKVTQSFCRSHKDTDVEIHVANINMKDDASDEVNEDVSGIEIKINVSRCDKNRRNKVQEKSLLDSIDIIRKHSKFQSEIGRYLPANIFKRRRISLPNELESKRPKRISDETCRRKSGGHVYRAYNRKSSEGKIMDDNERTQRTESLNKYSRILSERKVVSRHEASEVSYSEGPMSSHDDSQNSMRAESPNIYTSQETTEYESGWDAEKLKAASPKRHSSIEKLKVIPEELSQSDEIGNIELKTPMNQKSMSSFCAENVSTFDFDCFDVAPNDSCDTYLPQNDEISMSSRLEESLRVRRLEDIEKYRNPYAQGTDALEINLNTVPIYTTKDGKITYSPNPRYTYRALIIEARRREEYPHFRDVHFSKKSRDYQLRKLKSKRDSPAKEDERWNEENSSRMRLSSSESRQKSYDSKLRTNRMEKNDRWREYSDESEQENINNSSLMELERSQNFHNDFEATINDNSEILERGSAIESEKMNDSLELKSQDEKLIENQRLDETEYNELQIFNGEELELYSPKNDLSDIPKDFDAVKNYSEPVTTVEESSQRTLDVENEKQEYPVETLSHNKSIISKGVDPILSDDDSKDLTHSTNKNTKVSMKPPMNFNNDQDSQMLSDSGLDSSTTYTDGSKEHRQIGIWRGTLLSQVEKEIPRQITEKVNHDEVGKGHTDVEMNFIEDKNNETQTQEIASAENYCKEKNGKDHVLDMKMADINEEIQREDSDNRERNFSRQTAKEFKSKNSIDIQKLTQLFLSKTKDFDNIESDILKGLDLAFSKKHKVPAKLYEINATKVPEESQEKSSNASEVTSAFATQTSSFLGIRKGIDGSIRRASSDEVPHRESRPIFSDISSASVVTLKKTPRIFGEFLRARNYTDNLVGEEAVISQSGNVGFTNIHMDHQFEKPEIPNLPLRSFIQTKNDETKTSEQDNSIESEVSRFDDTLSSTQFGSEYAASQQNESTGLNFLSTSSQEAIDATDLKQVRKNLALCALDDKTKTTDDPADENNKQQMNNIGEKFIPFSGRISSESEDDSNAQDGSPIRKNEVEENKEKLEENGKGTILSFSGRIQSPESNSGTHNSPKINHEEIDRKLIFSGRISSPENLDVRDPHGHSDLIEKSPKLLDDNEKNLTFLGRIQGETDCQIKTSLTNFNKIPKFIIKKSECSSRSSSISQIVPSDQSAQKSIESKVSVSSSLPKIPKMIIRNVRSRPGTPTIEENAVELTFPKTITEGDQKVFEVKIKLDGNSPKKDYSENSIKKSIGVIECKIPKMKIKLDEKNPKMIFENASLQLRKNDNGSLSLKNVPKVKIRKIRRSSSREEKKDREKSESTLGKLDKSKNEREKSTESSCKYVDREKIRKLKIKKPEVRAPSPSPERSRKKRSRSPIENSQKKFRKNSSRHRSSESKTSDSKSNLMDESNASSTQGLSEKIPKVIIKRTSPSAEFKCELSKDGGESIIKDSKWQPEVKLERFEVLDSIAKSPGRMKLPLRMLEVVTKLKFNSEKYSCSRTWRTSSDPTCKNDRSLSRGRRRNSDPEQSNLGKPSNKNHQGSSPEKPKSSSVRSANDDWDDEPVLRLSRRDFSRRIRDETSQDTTKDTILERISQIRQIKEESISILTKETSRQTLMTEEITRSEFDFPNASSSHKKPNELILNPLIPSSTDEIANDVVDSKSLEGVNSVIKLESSDESQTTIEILPASSPDISQPESEVPIPLKGKRRIANGDLVQVYTEDAIPTQFELELEIVDNSSESVEAPELTTNPQSPGDGKGNWNYCPSAFYDTTNLKNSCVAPGPSFIHENMGDDREILNSEAKSVCCSDSLVKEVLAAKETLKRCLALPKASTSLLRTKTAAEKKQGSFVFAGFSGYDEKDEEEKSDNSSVVFQENSKTSRNDSQMKNDNSSSYKKNSKSEKISTSTDKKEENIKQGGKSSSRNEERKRSATSSSKSSRGSKKRPCEFSNHGNDSIKKMRPPSVSTKSYSVRSSKESDQSSSRRTITSSKGPKSSKSVEQRKTSYTKQEKTKSNEAMPILEPEGTANIEMSESSRSPPVITKQDSNQLSPGSPKEVDEKVQEKIENIIGQETEGVTFADIVSQMAYHEKATIKHKRYCILCERWFPTVSRHREHLAGYQHRHTELTQRRTVHALFMLFTGKPCPRLLPASIARTDCAPGEPTPLQIAVQDVAISLEKGVADRKKINKEND